MRLLNTHTLKPCDFYHRVPPRYCTTSIILPISIESQTQTSRPLLEGTDTDSLGSRQVRELCAQAKALGFDWLWLAAFCLDGSSRSELYHAYRHIFRWFLRSEACLAYLHDVSVAGDARRGYRMTNTEQDQFRRSEWFMSIWTLQALVAPKEVYFFDKHLTLVGVRTKMTRLISSITGIDTPYLGGTKLWDEASLATRMFWASHRVFPNPEDEAYALIGLVPADIVPDYGEGATAAFYRLQCSVLANSNDQSLFAWILPGFDNTKPFGMLARSVRDFANSKDIESSYPPSPILAHGFTKQGVYFSRHTNKRRGATPDHVLLTLRCNHSNLGGEQEPQAVAIAIHRFGSSWYRVNCGDWVFSDEPMLDGGYVETFHIGQPGLTISFDDLLRDVDRHLQRQGRETEERIDRRRILRTAVSVTVPLMILALRVVRR